MYITEFALWAPQGGLPIDVIVPNLAIRLSTSPRLPSTLSPVFADNIGPDETTVFSGPLHLVDPRQGQYGLHVPLQTPFYYDPSQGSLLMDYWNFETIPAPSGGGYSVYWASRAPMLATATAGNAYATTATAYGENGMFVRFTVTPVPEPSTWALLAVGLGVMVFPRSVRHLLRRKELRS